MDTLAQDLRYAVRKLVRSPGFTLIAVVTLALAIGATTAIFSVVNGVLLKPLPYPDPDRLVLVTNTTGQGKRAPMSTADFLDVQSMAKSFVGMSPVNVRSMNLTGGTEAVRIPSARVGANFWAVMGVSPAGRGFAPKEDEPGASRVVVLSDGLWKRRFGGDAKVIGKTIALDGEAYTVVGIAPAGFAFPRTAELWVPIQFTRDELDPINRGVHWLDIFGRVAPGVSVAQADREVAALARRLEQDYANSNTGFGGAVIGLQQFLVGDVRPALLVMLGAVSFVLLIACANVANLLLVRATARETEMAVRTALGAGRWRILRQLITESVLLAVVGGLAGALLAVWAVDLLVSLAPRNVPRLDEVRVDGSVLLFTAGAALLTGVLFGLIPALHTARANVGGMLKEGARGSSGGRSSARVRSALVVGEMALAVVLLIGAGLLIKSFAKLLDVDPGFRPEQVITFDVAAPEATYGENHQRRALAEQVLARMRAIPGVQSAAIVTGLPMSGGTARTVVNEVGAPPDPPNARKITNMAFVTPGYFATMGIRFLRGRDFSEHDRSGAPLVAIVNQEFANRYFPGQDPIGKRIALGWEQDTVSAGRDSASVTLGGEIIGVVGDVRRSGLGKEVLPETYIAWVQPTQSRFNVVLRSTATPTTVMTAVRSQMRALDPDLPVNGLRPLGEVVSDSVAQPRFYMLLLGSFATIALVLAAVGIYGVISYTVSQRTRELGIRIALGASRGKVVGDVLVQGIALTLTGVAFGVAGAFLVTRVIATLLFGVRANDPLTFAAVAGVLTCVALLASYLPARRAARIDPVLAIRAD